MIRRALLIFALSVVLIDLWSQDGVMTRLFFPLSYGINFPLRNSCLSKNFMNSEGVEYRFKKMVPWFVRLSVENLNYGYSVRNNAGINVTKSELGATGYYLGTGVRATRGKFRFTGAFRAGGLNYRYPVVSDLGSIYEVFYIRNTAFTGGFVAGIEYYFAGNIAAIMESHYMLVPVSNSFWEKNFQHIGLSLGITTTLF